MAGNFQTPPSSAPITAARHTRRSFLGMGALGALGLGGLSLGVSGCSSSGAPADPNDFVFTFWGTGAEKDAVTKVLQAAAGSAGLTAKPQSIPTNYDTKLNTLLAANTPPDAGYLSETMAMRLGEQGKLVNAAGEPAFANYLPTALHWYSAEGAVAQTCQEAMTLFFDTEVAQKAGVSVPTSQDAAWSWDQLVQAADALTADSEGRKPSESGFDASNVQRYGFAAPTGLFQLFALLRSNGVAPFNEDGTKSNLDTPEAIKVFLKVRVKRILF